MKELVMTRVYWKYVVLFVLGVFFFVSFSKTMYYFMELEFLDANFTYIYKEPLMAESLAEQAESLRIGCEIRMIYENAEIQPAGPGRSAKGFAVYAEGNKILDMYLGSEKSSCVLSSGLAESLFDSGNVRGEEIRYEKKQYIVKGVLHEESPILFLNPSGRDEDSQAETAVVMVRDIGALNYINAENLFQGGDEKIDVDFMKWLIQLLLCIFFLWILVLLLKFCRKYGKKEWLYMVVVTVLWMAFMKIFVFGNYPFPIRILPGKCSDFEGWSDLSESVFRQFSCMIRYKDLPVIESYYEGFYGCIFSLVLTGALLKMAVYCRKWVNRKITI